MPVQNAVGGRIMVIITLIILSAAFALRALWATKKGSTPTIRVVAKWRVAGWTALALLMALALRPHWEQPLQQGWILLPILGVALWIAMDGKVRGGGRGTLGRTMIGCALAILSGFSLIWFRLGPPLAEQPLLTLTLTGEKEEKSITWQQPAQPPQTETHSLYRVITQSAGPEGPTDSVDVLGDVVSVRAQRIRLWWPLEMLGFPPAVWLDGLRSEYLDPELAKQVPAQFYPLQQPATLLGPSLQAWCTLVWQKAFRSGMPSWWMELAQLESAGISLVDERGAPHRATIEVWANGHSLELLRKPSLEQEETWLETLRSWCPDSICERSPQGTPSDDAPVIPTPAPSELLSQGSTSGAAPAPEVREEQAPPTAPPAAD